MVWESANGALMIAASHGRARNGVTVTRTRQGNDDANTTLLTTADKPTTALAQFSHQLGGLDSSRLAYSQSPTPLLRVPRY